MDPVYNYFLYKEAPRYLSSNFIWYDSHDSKSSGVLNKSKFLNMSKIVSHDGLFSFKS